jgi:predicted nucleic acid-binding protein
LRANSLAASRKLQPLGFCFDDAYTVLRELQTAWTTKLPDWKTLDAAARLTVTHALSSWDALLIAASAAAGVTRLFSEDLGGRPPIAGVELVNPFAALQ